MEFKLRYCSLQAEQKPTVGTCRIIHAVAAGDKTAAYRADVEQRIPIRTVASEPGHVDGENEANLTKPYSPHQLFEAGTLSC